MAQVSQELYYTSVARGLQPGRRGFCAVAVTRGMPDTYAQRIEALSVYTPIFQPHDPNAGKNPVAFCHWRIALGGRTTSVLSRVCFSGLDYTRRANKFAHHIILDPREQAVAGPAWVMSQPGIMETAWTGEPHLINHSRKIPQGDSKPGVASGWQRITGDAGWAGVLAESFLSNPERPSFIIFKPGIDLLPLIGEALRFIPPDRRWEVTFSTYFTTLPQGTTCVWRGRVRNSECLREAKRRPGTLVIDLTGPLGRAEGGALVEFARTGKAPAPVHEPAPEPVAKASAEGEIPDDDLTPLQLQPVCEREDIPLLKATAEGSEEDMIPAAKFRKFVILALIFPLILVAALAAVIKFAPELLKSEKPEGEGQSQVKEKEDKQDQSQVATLSGEIKQLSGKIENLKAQISEVEKKLRDESKASSEKIKQKIEDLTNKVKTLQKQPDKLGKLKQEIEKLQEKVALLEFKEMKVNVIDGNGKFEENMEVPIEGFEPDKIGLEVKGDDVTIDIFEDYKRIDLKIKLGESKQPVIRIELSGTVIKFKVLKPEINQGEHDAVRKKLIEALRNPLILTDANGKELKIYLISE